MSIIDFGTGSAAADQSRLSSVEIEANCPATGNIEITTFRRDFSGMKVILAQASLPTRDYSSCRSDQEFIERTYRHSDKTSILGRCDAQGVYYRYAFMADGQLVPLAPSDYGTSCYLLNAVNSRNRDPRPIRWTFICDPVAHLIVNSFDSESGRETPVYLVDSASASACGETAYTLQRFKERENHATAVIPDSDFNVHRLILDIAAEIAELPTITTSDKYYASLYREHDRVQDHYPGPRPTFFVNAAGELLFDVIVEDEYRGPFVLASNLPGVLESEARRLNLHFDSLEGVRWFAFCDGPTLFRYEFDAHWVPRLVMQREEPTKNLCQVHKYQLTDRTTAIERPYTE